MKLKVFINHGRYMVHCPTCNNAHTVELNVKTFVCAACWQGLNAKKFETDKFGALVDVPHVQKIFETRDQAKAAGEEHELEFPSAEVMKILRPRPVENMNWIPGETLEFLRAENKDHGLDGER